jgi:hypothetical protein
MDMKDFSDANRRRCESADGFNHRLSDWSPSDWMVATLGELREALRDEIADAFTYLDLFAQSEGFYLEDASINKFNVVSARIGYPEILSGAADKE